MLSDKLLSKTDYNCDREIRTLELLKLRFGDANLHNCEVVAQMQTSYLEHVLVDTVFV